MPGPPPSSLATLPFTDPASLNFDELDGAMLALAARSVLEPWPQPAESYSGLLARSSRNFDQVGVGGGLDFAPGGAFTFLFIFPT